MQGEGTYFDSLIIRKFASPEPSVGAPGAETLMTSGAGSAKFYTSLANANSDTGGVASPQYTLSSGVVPIYVRDNLVETIALTATDAGSKTGTSGPITVQVAPANKIVFTSTAQTLVAGAASAAYTVEVRDQYDNLRTSDALALTLSSSSGVGKFDTSAGGAFTNSTININTVNGIGTFFYKDTVTGTPTITVSCTGLTSGTQAQTITPAAVSASTSTISVSPTSIAAGGSAATITVTAKDQYSNLISGIAAANVVIASTGTGNTLVQPAAATNASGQTTGTITSTKAEAKTISVT
ncbi:MAG: invasin domain 3-containing protein, partial [Candidatus Subteraquimicrobiales bacterium]|nr:invasin domain 3-containing protein [Candidatus Subteraquimicrobiales bacterium]